VLSHHHLISSMVDYCTVLSATVLALWDLERWKLVTGQIPP
jgi:hypothetical protein